LTIHIQSLKIDAIIGLLDFERDTEQQVIIDLEASYDYNNNEFIDYAVLVELIAQQVKQSRYGLLEDALDDLKEQITSAYPTIDRLWLKISKPHILNNCVVALSQSWNLS
jgi:dihydroneopterin aldolase